MQQNSPRAIQVEEHDRFAVAERNVTHGSDTIALTLATNLAARYPLLTRLASQCPNIHQLCVAAPLDLLDDGDLLARAARKRLVDVLDDEVIAATEPVPDVYVAYEELPALPLSKSECWHEIEKFSEVQLRSLLFQMCNAVASMHNISHPRDPDLARQVLIHADLKPSQFLMSKPEPPESMPRIWLTDFETATGAGEHSCLQKAGLEEFFGSYRYAHPAVFSEINHRYSTIDDIYAFAWTIADIVYSLQTGADYINVDRPDTFSQDTATRTAAIKIYLARLEKVTSPQFAHALEMIVLNNFEVQTDISAYWVDHLQPAIESLYGLTHVDMPFSHKKQ